MWLLGALVYYASLACYRYTWVFSSGDSGDWLASSKIWFVPQPFGSPLYISLAHLVGTFSGNLVANMTFWLSVVPAAISVALIYQAARNVLDNQNVARIAALIMIGASVLTSQATIVEEYSLAVMLLSASIWAYTAGRKNWAVVFIGLGCAVHIILFPIAFILFFVHYKKWRYWIKRIPLFLLFAVTPYALIIVLMALDTPRWIAGNLSWSNLVAYISTVSTIGKLSIMEAPQRIFYLVLFVFGSLGLAVIPATKYAFENRIKPFPAMLALTAALSLWLYLTDIDKTSWTFIIYAVPCVAILAVLGLNNTAKLQKVLVAGVAIALIFVNSVCLNARKLDAENPVATNFYNDTLSLPDGSYVLAEHGGWYTFAVMYAISQGKDIKLIFTGKEVVNQNAPLFYLKDGAYVK